MKLDYNVVWRRYTIDDQPTTRANALSALPAQGMTVRDARHTLRLYKLCANIESRLPPVRPGMVGGSRAVQIILTAFVNGLDRARNLPRAERWLRENLRAAKKPGGSAYSLKHQCDGDYQKAGKACYLIESDFIDCLRRCGFTLTPGGRVYAKEVQR